MTTAAAFVTATPAGTPLADIVVQLRDMVETLRDDRVDEAEAKYLQLAEADDRIRNMLVFPVLFKIQRGQLFDALRLVDEQPAGRYPELRALCLKLLNDPTWESEATALVDAPDPDIALAMRQLLGRPATRH